MASFFSLIICNLIFSFQKIFGATDAREQSLSDSETSGTTKFYLSLILLECQEAAVLRFRKYFFRIRVRIRIQEAN
jgi:hypothetical protein